MIPGQNDPVLRSIRPTHRNRAAFGVGKQCRSNFQGAQQGVRTAFPSHCPAEIQKGLREILRDIDDMMCHFFQYFLRSGI